MATIDRADIELLAQNPDPMVKANLCRKVLETLDHLELGAMEQQLARDVLTLLARDVEKQVRISVARQISASPHLTEELARRLALDVEDEVALPVIETAEHLAENLLLSLLKVPSTVRRVAIAARPDVTEDVSGAIIDCANRAAIVRLVKNEKARIAEGQLVSVTSRWGRLPPVQGALVERPDLPSTVVEQLVSVVSSQLRNALIERYDLEPELVTHLVSRGREMASQLILRRPRVSEYDPMMLALQLQKSGRLSVPLLFLILVSGDIDLFCTCLSVTCRIPLDNVRQLAMDRGGQGLVRLLERAGIEARLIIAFQTVMEQAVESGYLGAEPERARFQIRAVTRVYEVCADLNDSALDNLLATVMSAGALENGGLIAQSGALNHLLEA